MAADFTAKQGQYLSFIYHYSKINKRPPAQLDIQRYFEVTPPTVHQMILTLERKRLLSRTPRTSRSLHVLVPLAVLPPLD